MSNVPLVVGLYLVILSMIKLFITWQAQSWRRQRGWKSKVRKTFFRNMLQITNGRTHAKRAKASLNFFTVKLVTWSITSSFDMTYTQKELPNYITPGEVCNRQRWWTEFRQGIRPYFSSTPHATLTKSVPWILSGSGLIGSLHWLWIGTFNIAMKKKQNKI
jgi:hypothetical protein